MPLSIDLSRWLPPSNSDVVLQEAGRYNVLQEVGRYNVLLQEAGHNKVTLQATPESSIQIKAALSS